MDTSGGDVSAAAPAFRSAPADVLAWIERLHPGHVTGAGFVGLGAYRAGGDLDPDRLRAALDELVARHHILRTVLSGDRFEHRLRPAGPVPLRVTDAAPFTEPVDRLPAGAVPGLSAVLHRGHGSTVVLTARHNVADHWSMELLAQDLARAYGGRPAEPGGRQFEQSARAASARRDQARIGRAVRHWRAVLDDPPAVAPAGGGAGGLTGERHYALPVDHAALAAASSAARTTPFVALLTAYAMALVTVAGVPEVLIPVFTSGRARDDWDVVGPFMNVVPVRLDLAGVARAADGITRVHQAFVTALAHEAPLAGVLPEVPGIELLATAGGVPVGGFELVQFPPPQDVPIELTRLPVGPRHGATVLPLSGLCCWLQADGPAGYAVTVRYRPGVVDASWVDRLAATLQAVVEEIVTRGRARAGIG